MRFYKLIRINIVFKGHVSFRHNITGTRLLGLQPLNCIAPEYPAVTKIDVECPDNRALLVTVHFETIASEHDATTIGRIVAEHIADKIAFQSQSRIDEPATVVPCFERIQSEGEAPGSLSGSAVQNWGGTGDLVGVWIPDQPAAIALETLLNLGSTSKDFWYSRFRWVLNHHDPVARFLHLYSILLSLEGGPKNRQGPVDDFIKTHEPLVSQQTVTYDGKTVTETIYSRLRNEIAHVRPRSTPQTTRAEMEQHLGKLADLAQKAIELHG